jgi:glycerol-3-phosphate cytidylyltransferase
MIFDRISDLRKQGLRVGIVASQFDIMHAGHVAMLSEARSQCDYLIVALQNDASCDRPEKNSPVQSIVERQIQLQSLKYVDEIVVYNTEKDLEDLLLILPVNVRILGEEYRDRNFTGKQICLDQGIEIYYNKRQHSFSSSDLRQRVISAQQTREK